MLNRKELREQVPHGHCKIIAKKAGVTQKSVSDYFATKNNSEKIEMAVLEVLAQIGEKKKRLLDAARF
jgi:predicted transcriptional regulator